MHGKAGGLGLVGSRLSHPPLPILFCETKRKQSNWQHPSPCCRLSERWSFCRNLVMIAPSEGGFQVTCAGGLPLSNLPLSSSFFCIIFPPSICLPLSIPLACPNVPTLLRCLAVFACGKRRKVGNALFIKYLLDSCC